MSVPVTKPEGYMILIFRDGKVFAHQNRVSNAIYTYKTIEQADKKAFKLEAKMKEENCLVVAINGVVD